MESRFNLSSDDNRVRVWKPRGERLNPTFVLQRHTTPSAGVMIWVLLPTIHGSFGTASWASHEFDQTRGKVAANME
ncbi:UNVERIFIED_CONTAM: hypothetical protein NCL1_07655 [Trichonephila clavipes]